MDREDFSETLVDRDSDDDYRVSAGRSPIQFDKQFPLEDFDALLSARNQASLPEALRARIDRQLKDRFSAELTAQATTLLLKRQPQMSALSPLSSWQRAVFTTVPVLLIFGLVFYPAISTKLVLCILFLYCIASTTLKGALMFASLKTPGKSTISRPTRTPIVTLFLPVHDEDRAIVALVSELKKLDYPSDRLDIKFLAEADDAKTLKALSRVNLPKQFSVLEIPKSEPQTKPKAMNYALPFARGEIVGIYDAEDAPEADQIKKAVAALEAADERTVCVQSRLNHYDATETFISRMASLEYTLWFDMLLRGLSNLRLPIPLGGTSLFIRTEALRAIDGWDPNNVTEDADLGVRLARKGWRAEVIDSTTWEEPPVALGQWIGQRSRWIKGFMVTWLVHMRSPRLLFRELGWWRALAINVMLLDGFVAFLVQPVFWVAIGFAVVIGGAPWSDLLTPSISLAMAWVFVAGHVFILISTLVAVRRRFGVARALWSPCLWLYWQLATIPAYRALREMFGQQSSWSKTAHGLSKAAKQRRDNALQDD